MSITNPTKIAIGIIIARAAPAIAAVEAAVAADAPDIPLNAALDYFGSMADIVDPLYWGTDDQLPSPFESSDGAVTALGVPSYYVSTENANVVFMAFNLSMMPDDAQQAVLGKFLAWSGSTTSNEDVLNLPTQFALYENYPNPFNPVTTIRFDVPEISDVNITVYNVLGKQVNSFDLNTMSPGTHHIKWRGIDNAGKPVSSGLYFYTIKAGDFFATKKMMLLK